MFRKLLSVVLLCSLALPACLGEPPGEDVSAEESSLAATVTDLVLQNGWTSTPYATRNAGVSLESGIVYLRGAISNGTDPAAFTLPTGYRPATNVYVPVDLCNARKGRLLIQPDGRASVQAEAGAFGQAQCFTSLEGASFALSASGFTPLALQNNWTHAPFGTSSAAVRNVGGIVNLKGAIANGTGSVVFTLPSGLRPAANVYVPVDLCDAKKGRLLIRSNGETSVEAEAGAFDQARCFTSLDGASFVLDTSAFAALSLQNGWTHAPFGTSPAAAADLGGIVHFKGAIASGTSWTAFTLPSGLRPKANVYVPMNLCYATKGRLQIQPDGQVQVQAEAGTFANAQCFTSLDGASFVLSELRPLALQNGWTSTPYGTGDAAVALIGGIVHLRGAIANGTDPVAVTLPSGLRPATNVYVPVDLCNAKKGRLLIQSDGRVSVQAQAGAFSEAQCFTSLEGASFALSTSSFSTLALQNGWSHAPFGTRNAAVTNDAGFVRFAGAIAGGGSQHAFTLPSGLRPAATAYVPITLCNAAKGRLHIEPTGAVTVQFSGAFFDAQCFTSLEGVSFPLSTSSFSTLALQNGWTRAPFGVRDAAVMNDSGIIRFAGAISSGSSAVIATLPIELRPAATVYVPVDQYGVTKGRLVIQPGGSVTVEAEGGAFYNAQSFTSLEGVWYAR